MFPSRSQDQNCVKVWAYSIRRRRCLPECDSCEGWPAILSSMCVLFLVMRNIAACVTIALASTAKDSGVVLVASLGVVTVWPSVATSEFRLDVTAIATGRAPRGCILQSAGGNKVTAAILAMWNCGARIRWCSCKLGAMQVTSNVDSISAS